MRQVVGLDIVKVDENGYHLLVPCELEDGNSYYLIIDTGASNTVLDRDSVSGFINPLRTGDYYIEDYYRNNLEQSREMGDKSLHFSFGKLREIKFGNMCLKNLLFPLLDLSNIRDIYANIGFSNVIGVLGGDFFVQTNAQINYLDKTIILDHDSTSIKLS